LPLRKDRRNWTAMVTHLGNAVGVGDYLGSAGRDNRGNAQNINSVNNNYSFENFHAQRTPQVTAKWEKFHYRDSKWIYIYDETGEFKRGRYAVLVIPDGGLPNANAQFVSDTWSEGGLGGTGRQQQNYLTLLDSAFTPRGGPSGLFGQVKLEGYVGADIIKSADGLALRDVTQSVMDHVTVFGPLSGRTEYNMVLRKNSLPQGALVDDLEQDAELISSMQSAWSYMPLLGPHWEHDRIVIDLTRHDSSPMYGAGKKATLNLIWHTLDNLKYYWGPESTGVGAREGQYTPYHDTAADPGQGNFAKSTLLAWFRGAQRNNRSNTGDKGFLFDADPLVLDFLEAPEAADITDINDAYVYAQKGAINETGTIPAVKVADLPFPFSGGNAGTAYVDARYYVEVCTSGLINCTSREDVLSFFSTTYSPHGDADARHDAMKIDLYIDGNLVRAPEVIAIGGGNYGRKAGDDPKMDTTVSTFGRGKDFSKFDHTGRTVSMPASHGRYMPANYVLLHWPVTQGPSTGRYLMLKDRSTGTVLDMVDLGETGGSDNSFSTGWSCYDYRINQHPRVWLETGNVYNEDGGRATPAWRSKSARTDEVGDQAWNHGMNTNFVHAFLPGAESYRPGFSIIDQTGNGSPGFQSVSGLNGSKRGEQNWFISNKMAYEHVSVGGARIMTHRGRFMTAPLGFFPRYDQATGTFRPEPFMTCWSDLMRHAPVERYFASGFISDSMTRHGEYQIYDGLDNDMDGHVDNLVSTPQWAGAPLYGLAGSSAGHYIDDRASVSGINLNEIFHPAAVWFTGVGSNNGIFRGQSHLNEGTDHIALIGKKPFKGYTAWVDYRTRAHWGHYGATAPGHSFEDLDYMSFAAGVWYENLYADGGANHTSYGGAVTHHHHDSRSTMRNMWVGTSPVFSLYVTAQTLDGSESPTAEIKVRATVERTWDGKTNFLEFRWIPSEAGLLR
jgi:hypothetical protein